MPFLGPEYHGLYMVADDGVLLVEIKVHERAREVDWAPIFREQLERIREKEGRAELKLVIAADGDEAFLP